MIGNGSEEKWASTGMPARALCLLSLVFLNTSHERRKGRGTNTFAGCVGKPHTNRGKHPRDACMSLCHAMHRLSAKHTHLVFLNTTPERRSRGAV